MRSLTAVVFLLLACGLSQAEAWVARRTTTIGRYGGGYSRGYRTIGRPVAYAAYRPYGYYGRPVYYGRRHLLEQDAETDEAVIADFQSGLEDDPELVEVDSSECPIDVGSLIAKTSGNTIEDFVERCNTDSGDAFCQNCVAQAQNRLVMAFHDHFQDDPAGLEKARTSDVVPYACGKATVEALEQKGLNANEAFFRKIEECQASAAATAAATCPMEDSKFEGEEFQQLGEKCLDVFHAASGAPDTPLDEARYCSDCYWSVLQFVVNGGAVSDEFWCAFRAINATGDGAASEEGERKVFNALYDDSGFVSCSNEATEKLLSLDADGDGNPDEINPLSDPFAVKIQKECWQEDNKPEQGSMLTKDMKQYAKSVKC